MKNAIAIKKGHYETINYYAVYGADGSMLVREKSKPEYRKYNDLENYIVSGFVNGEYVMVNCKDYRSAKALFMAMQ